MLTFSLPNILLSLKELLVVWVNQTIYHNCIYEPEIFNKKLSFDLIVNVSRNPSLNAYIERVVDEILQLLLTGSNCGDGGKIAQLSLVIYDLQSNKDIRRYSIKFQQFINLEPFLKNIPIQDFLNLGDQEPVIELPSFNWEEIHSHFKFFLYQHQNELQRIKTVGGPPIKQDLFYKLILDSHDDHISLETRKDWVKLTPQTQYSSKKVRFIPVAEVETGFLSFGLQNEYIRY